MIDRVDLGCGEMRSRDGSSRRAFELGLDLWAIERRWKEEAGVRRSFEALEKRTGI